MTQENTAQFNTPILFIIFNRPDTTKRVFEEIRKIKPTKLFIAADGPRKENSKDIKMVEETRKIVETIDWPCEVHHKFEKKNLSCKIGTSSSIDWFFKNVECGIILEDDCVPNPTFFQFCSEMLERYRDNPQIMLISGDNFLGKAEKEVRKKTSYYFSRYPLTWGWASWKRVWSLYDYDMKTFPTTEASEKLKKVLQTKEERKYWFDLFKKEYHTRNSWDYQMAYAIWLNNGICITPSVNLISNIGFGKEATNTINPNHNAAYLPTENMVFPLVHPDEVAIDRKADKYTFRHHFLKKLSFNNRIRNFIHRLLSQQKII